MTISEHKCKCGSTDFFVEVKGTATGLYCSECGKWQKWLTKDEVRAFEHKGVEYATKKVYSAIKRKLMERINESAIVVSTVKVPHTYMKAVGTRELEKILEEVFNHGTK